MFSKIDYIMVNVSAMDRSVAFYRDTLGLTLKLETPGWTEFETGASVLALHLVEAIERTKDGGRGGPVAGTCSIGFSVPDIDAAYAQLQSRGARFVMPPTTQANEGIRLAVCVDPDGLAISFAQPIAR
jgi:lactoylglutathione lyase